MKRAMTREEAIASLGGRLSRRSRTTEGGCIEWTGYVNPNGYGQVTIPAVLRSEEGLGRITTAPRLACWLAHGPRPGGSHIFVLHSCDNRACINPEHLRWGDRWDNTQDAVERHRHVRGEDHPDAVLTDEEVLEVIGRANQGERVRDLADEYGVDWSMIYVWLRGEGRARHVA